MLPHYLHTSFYRAIKRIFLLWSIFRCLIRLSSHSTRVFTSQSIRQTVSPFPVIFSFFMIRLRSVAVSMPFTILSPVRRIFLIDLRYCFLCQFRQRIKRALCNHDPIIFLPPIRRKRDFVPPQDFAYFHHGGNAFGAFTVEILRATFPPMKTVPVSRRVSAWSVSLPLLCHSITPCS